MKLLSSVLALIVLAATPAHSSAQTARHEVEEAVHSFYAAIGTLDPDHIIALTTPEFEIVDGGMRMDSRAFEAFVAELASRGSEVDFALQELNTVVAGDVAYTTLRAVNRPVDTAFLETLILRRVEGAWLIDRFHSTPVR